MQTFLKQFGTKYYVSLIVLLLLCMAIFRSCLVKSLSASVCDVWLKDLTLNLIAEILGILLVFLGVNRTVRINKETEKKKFKEIAFRQLKRVFCQQIFLLFNMFKASVEVQPVKNYEKLEDLFDETYFYELEFLDLLKFAPVLTPRGEEMDWLDYLFSEFSILKAALDKVVDRYSFYLDSQEVELIEKVTDAGFIRFITSMQEAKQLDKISLIRGDLLSECQSLLKEYIKSLLKLIDLYNQSVEAEIKINIESAQWSEWWDNNARPKIGDSRIKFSDN